MSELIAALLVWIGLNTPYDTGAVAHPEIRLVDDICADAALDRHCRIVGYYNHHTAVITLDRPWSITDRRDRSVLLHELVHHVQASLGALDFDSPMDRCRGESEAFVLMALWLAANGERRRLNVRRAKRIACAGHFAGGIAGVMREWNDNREVPRQ